MDQKSQVKVINAGFTIIRCEDVREPIIKVKDKKSHEWRFLEKFDSKAARDRVFKSLLEQESYIQD